MYPQYPQPQYPQQDPLRLIFWGFVLGFIFAVILFFKLKPDFSIGDNSQSNKTSAKQLVAKEVAKPTLPLPPAPKAMANSQTQEVEQEEHSYNYGSPAVRKEQIPKDKSGITIQDDANIRIDQGVVYQTIGKVKRNDIVWVITESIDFDTVTPHKNDLPIRAKWYYIRTETGEEGWVFASAFQKRRR